MSLDGNNQKVYTLIENATQTNRESIKSGIKTINAIIKASVPIVLKTIRTYLKGIK